MEGVFAFLALIPKSFSTALIFKSLSEALGEQGRGAPIANPSSEEGTLYKTGHVARITLDGNVEFLEKAGRTVMLETLMGRVYVDLKKVEDVLCECDGVTAAHAYTYYGGDNIMMVGADVKGVAKEDAEKIMAFAAEKLEKAWVPTKIVCQ